MTNLGGLGNGLLHDGGLDNLLSGLGDLLHGGLSYGLLRDGVYDLLSGLGNLLGGGLDGKLSDLMCWVTV